MEDMESRNVENKCISKMPDDVLIHIISKLEAKDAVKTSVLSKRWRYLWTSIYKLKFIWPLNNYQCIDLAES